MINPKYLAYVPTALKALRAAWRRLRRPAPSVPDKVEPSPLPNAPALANKPLGPCFCGRVVIMEGEFWYVIRARRDELHSPDRCIYTDGSPILGAA